MKDLILKHALKNAMEFEGKPNPGAVLGRVLSEKPELKKDIPKLRKDIEIVIKGIEKLSLEEQQKKLKSLAPELLKEKKEKKKGLELPKAQKGKVVLRIAPSPSGPLHIGHAYGGSLNFEYAQAYNGKFIVRIEDTNPENIYPKAYDLIKDDTQWLTNNKVTEFIIQSERLGLYYDYAEKLVTMDKAYVCTCDVDQWRKLKADSQACPCRNLSVKEQQIRYAKMFNEYAEGEAVLKLKTDIQDKNPAMRDFSIMRINEHVHPKTKKENRVWPLMVYSVAVDDHELGMTHVLNGKDHADNGKKEATIMEYLGWKPPVYKHWGRINFKGLTLSTSQTKKEIEQKKYNGWDDIRLPFLMALRRRGYQPEALRKFALSIGLSLTDKTVSKEEFFKAINAFNKEIIESKANRYFLIQNKKKIKIKGAQSQECQVPLHPDHRKRGYRKFKTRDSFYITAKDFERLKTNKVHRLMDCLNFVKKGKEFVFHSTDYQDYKNAADQGIIIHWLPLEEKYINVEVLMEDNTKVTGLGEYQLKNLKQGDIIQFERFCFCRLDKKTKDKLSFWFTHK
ncbi:glutamate--tRNA ligase [Nanoarchaeota archaeon]